jgi:hypothetical protein
MLEGLFRNSIQEDCDYAKAAVVVSFRVGWSGPASCGSLGLITLSLCRRSASTGSAIRGTSISWCSTAPTMPPNFLCWQKPLRLGQDGKYLVGLTRWTSYAVRTPPTKSWISADSRVEFMRFENVDDDPEPKDLAIRWFATDEQALAVPFPGHPEVSVCQEPTLVKLPDGRLSRPQVLPARQTRTRSATGAVSRSTGIGLASDSDIAGELTVNDDCGDGGKRQP